MGAANLVHSLNIPIMPSREIESDFNLFGIGVMSGTSLDGIDLAFCDFTDPDQFKLVHFSHIPYPKSWVTQLSGAHNLNAIELKLLERDYSEYTAQHICNFIEVHQLETDFIGCHGHTIFHSPNQNITHQMLDGSIIAARTRCKTVCDFRSLDVALGGQGAPLVPIGDELLFGQFDACLNIGGFANISYRNGKQRKAYDICPANIVLNHLAEKMGKQYDHNGETAKKGTILPLLLQKLNENPYYNKKAPKSLGREWVEKHVFPELQDGNIADLMATCVSHIAIQVASSINKITKGRILTTGGGGHNSYLMKEISNQVDGELLLPSKDIVDNKEAIIFAFLGKLRLDRNTNTLASVTGAKRNSSGGAVYLGQ